jgi:hypothetical protein
VTKQEDKQKQDVRRPRDVAREDHCLQRCDTVLNIWAESAVCLFGVAQGHSRFLRNRLRRNKSQQIYKTGIIHRRKQPNHPHTVCQVLKPGLRCKWRCRRGRGEETVFKTQVELKRWVRQTLSHLCLAISTYWLQSILQGLCTLSLRITEWTDGSHVITTHQAHLIITTHQARLMSEDGHGWHHEYVDRRWRQR